MKQIFEQMLRNRKNDDIECDTIHISEFKEIFKKQLMVEIKFEDLKTIFNGKEQIAFID